VIIETDTIVSAAKTFAGTPGFRRHSRIAGNPEISCSLQKGGQMLRPQGMEGFASASSRETGAGNILARLLHSHGRRQRLSDKAAAE